MAQEQALIRTKILEFYDSVKREFPVKKILLYGSYARDEATDDSDIDVAVVLDEKNHNQRCDIGAKLMHYAFFVDPAIEPRCVFLDEYLHPEPCSILEEILRTGIEIV
jgi:predicted nucleotidyltransferase